MKEHALLLMVLAYIARDVVPWFGARIDRVLDRLLREKPAEAKPQEVAP